MANPHRHRTDSDLRIELKHLSDTFFTSLAFLSVAFLCFIGEVIISIIIIISQPKVTKKLKVQNIPLILSILVLALTFPLIYNFMLKIKGDESVLMTIGVSYHQSYFYNFHGDSGRVNKFSFNDMFQVLSLTKNSYKNCFTTSSYVNEDLVGGALGFPQGKANFLYLNKDEKVQAYQRIYIHDWNMILLCSNPDANLHPYS